MTTTWTRVVTSVTVSTTCSSTFEPTYHPSFRCSSTLRFFKATQLIKQRRKAPVVSVSPLLTTKQKLSSSLMGLTYASSFPLVFEWVWDGKKESCKTHPKGPKVPSTTRIPLFRRTSPTVAPRNAGAGESNGGFDFDQPENAPRSATAAGRFCQIR